MKKKKIDSTKQAKTTMKKKKLTRYQSQWFCSRSQLDGWFCGDVLPQQQRRQWRLYKFFLAWSLKKKKNYTKSNKKITLMYVNQKKKKKKAKIHEVLPFLSTNKENVVNVTLLLFFVVKSIFVRLIFIVGFFF